MLCRGRLDQSLLLPAAEERLTVSQCGAASSAPISCRLMENRSRRRARPAPGLLGEPKQRVRDALFDLLASTSRPRAVWRFPANGRPESRLSVCAAIGVWQAPENFGRQARPCRRVLAMPARPHCHRRPFLQWRDKRFASPIAVATPKVSPVRDISTHDLLSGRRGSCWRGMAVQHTKN